MSADRRSPIVSVVVPAYNREHHLARTLDSVLAQTMDDWECIVSDDGSTDGTGEVARRYAAADPRIRVVGGPNGGVAAARNRGFTATDPGTSFVTFLDSDDVWEPNALVTLKEALDRDAVRVAVYGLACCIDDDDQPIPRDDLPARMRERQGVRDGGLVDVGPGEPITFAELAVHNWVVTPGLCLARRAVVARVGRFDSAVDPADDWDFNIRMSRLGAIGLADQVVLRWRRHPETLTNTSDRWRRAFYRVRRKMLTDPANSREQTRVALTCYHLDFRAAAADARRLVSSRDVRGAAREAAKAGDRLARLLRAQLTARMVA
jgi:glycosyltransferase involved in cell wall biosynthesis